MAYLGVPYRIMYESRGFATGLTGIQVRVLRPGGLVYDGPFTMLELIGPGFSGRYYYDYVTNPLTMPEGDYFAFVNSPAENGKSSLRMELYKPWVTVEELQNELAALNASLTRNVPELTGYVYAHPILNGVTDSMPYIRGEVNTGNIDGAFRSDQSIDGYVQESDTRGSIKDETNILGTLSTEEII